jgi:hypothetical protein
VSAEANGNPGGGEFGRRPDEHVYAPGRYPRRPDVRTRVAPMAGTGGLDFEPEVEGQQEALRALLAPAPAPQSALAFEPEKGGALDRLSARPSGRVASPAAPNEEDIASLLALAGGRDAGAAEPPSADAAPPPRPAIPPPLDAAAGQAAFRGRPATAGDIEAELFGPGSARLAARSGPTTTSEAHSEAPPPAPGPSAVESPPADDAAGDEPPPTQSVASVFLSERVLGKRRRRKTTGSLRRSGQFRAVADKWVGRIYLRTKRTLSAIDNVTGMARLPLANIFWSAAIAALSLYFGLALPFAGAVFAAGLILTVAGQPARNLLGIAGIMILSASIAEVVRQRERFVEIFLDLFG